MNLGRAPVLGGLLSALGGLGFIATLWMVFYWVPTEASMGIVQRIFYIHVPAAWVAFMAFALAALCSGVYLWLKDDRLDAAAEAAAEGGLVFFTIMLIAGPLWARLAWGTWWTWEPRLTSSLLMWVVFVGYFLVRNSVEPVDRARRLSAVVAILGALNIPIIHVSVTWLRSLHPQPVVLKPEGPTLDPRMGATLGAGLLALTLLFFGLFLLRYAVALAERSLEASRARA